MRMRRGKGKRGYTPGVFAKSAQAIDLRRDAARSCFWKSARVRKELIPGELRDTPVFGRAQEKRSGNEERKRVWGLANTAKTSMAIWIWLSDLQGMGEWSSGWGVRGLDGDGRNIPVEAKQSEERDWVDCTET